ncbi:MAG TPA: hypothetical protein VEY91_11415 [Candidatus Limnocylindria bacterium]|nr:hypothetical protein [Candidatus Limnocylindria bacterium]
MKFTPRITAAIAAVALCASLSFCNKAQANTPYEYLLPPPEQPGIGDPDTPGGMRADIGKPQDNLGRSSNRDTPNLRILMTTGFLAWFLLAARHHD